MRTWFMRGGLAAVALCFALALRVTTICAADDPAATPSANAPFTGDPYLLDTDPLGDKLPETALVYTHEGRELRFADPKNLAAFQADPAKYLPKVDAQMIQQQMAFYPLDTCMISGDKLGGDMGKAVDVIYKNRLVRFCCADCVKDFNKKPDKLIAKLNAAVIAKQGPGYPLTTCVVSGEKLGGDMGAPVDLVVGNRLVRFCCPGCQKDFNKNPAKFLKTIDAAAAAKPASGKP